jgi:hypothetical protein
VFYKDRAGKMDVANPVAGPNDANSALNIRYLLSKLSQTIEMSGPIFYDVFMTERLLLSYVDLKLILNRNIQQFCLCPQ